MSGVWHDCHVDTKKFPKGRDVRWIALPIFRTDMNLALLGNGELPCPRKFKQLFSPWRDEVKWTPNLGQVFKWDTV